MAKRSTWGNVWREGVDRLFLHNRGYDTNTGQWNTRGVRQGLLQTGIGMLVPGGGAIASPFINHYNQTHQGYQAPNVGFTPTWGMNPGLTQQFQQPQQPTNQNGPQLPFSLTATRSGPIRNTITPTGSTPYSALVGLAAQNGGARGARGWGGAGMGMEASQQFLQDLRNGPGSDYIYTGRGGPILS